jgi:hypothetical protein
VLVGVSQRDVSLAGEMGLKKCRGAVAQIDP